MILRQLHRAPARSCANWDFCGAREQNGSDALCDTVSDSCGYQVSQSSAFITAAP